eukprot:CAMPEP_0119130472 /NCGR_PEP_ID=MMETSP1310-20130426/7804_1 /TAXON_ID=464262 /ORGANISM="Genus nov. species nov., Strain RCC2339" /LENGTH=58 /DNA_ID=CAMNT_0007120985 /DNA_START=38 /DNA_END=214 /DNA_ORIENTATION=-
MARGSRALVAAALVAAALLAAGAEAKGWEVPSIDWDFFKKDQGCAPDLANFFCLFSSF